MTILVGMDIFYWIRWDALGITEGINPFYLQFGSMWNSYLWIISQIGVIGTIFMTILATGYVWITVKVISNLYYLYTERKRKRMKLLAVKFFYHWWNQKGNNTEEGFDKWWELEGKKLL